MGRLLFAVALLVMFPCSLTAQDLREPEPPPVEAPERAEDEALEEADMVAGDAAEAGEPAPPAEPEWLRAQGFDTVICPFRRRVDYDRGEVECGLIKVPENREVSGSRTIELHFVRIPARGEDHEGNRVEVRDDPVIYLTGGPGVAVEGYVRRLKDHRLMAKRDLYILEQRGIGHSGDFCPFFAERNRAEQIRPTFEGAQRAFLELARTCVEGAKAAGVDVAAYHTFENARDVKALRLALGLQDWNVWGISYGSALGQAYLKTDPEGIRAVVLDAIVPLHLENLMRIAHWHTQNLEALFSACADQPACFRAFRDLEMRYRAAIENLTDEPLRVEVPESERYPTGEAWFFQDSIVGLPFGLLYDESNHPAVPAIIDGLTRAAERRRVTLFKAMALADMDQGFGISLGMSVAVRCLDHYVDRQAESAPAEHRAYPTLARAFGHLDVIGEMPALCREVGLEPREFDQYALVETGIPVLVANGALDPVTPVPLAEAILPGLTNARLAVFPHAGHGPTRSLDCAGDLLNGYFDDPAAELDAECIDSGAEPAEYIAPYFRTRAVPKAIVMKEEYEGRLRGHAIWAGSSLGLATLGWLVLGAGWVRRRLRGSRLMAAGGSRAIAFVAGLLATAHAAGLAAAAWATAEVTEAMLLVGTVGWGGYFAWLAPLAALVALAGLVQAWRYRSSLGWAARVGLWLTTLAVLSFSVCGLVWDLWPL